MSALDETAWRRTFAGCMQYIVRPVRDTLKWAKPAPGFVLMPGGVLVTEGELDNDAFGCPAVISAGFVDVLRKVGIENMSPERVLAYARVCARHFYGVEALNPESARVSAPRADNAVPGAREWYSRN